MHERITEYFLVWTNLGLALVSESQTISLLLGVAIHDSYSIAYLGAKLSLITKDNYHGLICKALHYHQLLQGEVLQRQFVLNTDNVFAQLPLCSFIT